MGRRRAERSIATFVIVTLVAVVTALLVGLGAVNYISERDQNYANLTAGTATKADQLAAGLALPLWNFDRDQVDKVIESAMRDPTVYGVIVRQPDVTAPGGTAVYVRVRGENWEDVAANEPFLTAGQLVQERTVSASGADVGSVTLATTPRFVREELRLNLWSTMARIVALDLLLVLSLWVLLRRTVILPLQLVERYAAAVSRGERIPAAGANGTRFNGELKSLQGSIEKMVGELDARCDDLRQGQATLAGILNSVPHSIFWKDREGRYLGCNAVFARATGVEDPRAIVGKTDFDLPWPREDTEKYRAADRDVVETGCIRRHMVEPLRLASGTTIWVDTTKVPLVGPDGRVYGVLGVYEDVTERKEAEEALRREKALTEAVFNSVPGVLYLFDDQGRILRWNANVPEVTGFSDEEILGTVAGGRQSPEDKARIGTALRTAMTEGHVELEASVVTKSGAGIPFYFRAVRMVADGKTYVVAIGVDITERKRAEAVLLESEKMRTVAGLAAGMAHEINNPLAGMLQNAQVVQNRLSTDLPANRRAAEEVGTTVETVAGYMERRGIPEMLRAIRSSGERAAEIVANMLSFSRPTTDALVRHHRLSEVLDRAIELAQSDYDLRRFDMLHLQVVREYADDLPEVMCRATEIQQVVLNLVKNAAQAIAGAAERGPGAPRIVVRTARVGNKARIEVEDNGPGMPEAVRQRVFEPFYTTKGPQSGTGLGLFVSYCIVARNHGGTISVESVEGKGTKFTIELPLETAGVRT